jgi:hypothetical protein
MPKFLSILYILCFGLLLMANLYHLSSEIKDDGADRGSIMSFVDTEEIKNMTDSPAVIEEQALPANTGSLIIPEESALFYIHHTTGLLWQHAETALLPPELSSCLSYN